MLRFKIKTVARYLGVHRNTVRNWILKGKLNATPAAAKQYAIEKKEFLKFCENTNIPSPVKERMLSEAFEQSPDSGTSEIAVKIPEKAGRFGSVLIVGGGIAGITAATELADAGFFVYVVEKTSGIGGTMARLDKTFPTNDCASCIILPKLVECARNSNIELLTLANVDKVSGSAGHFRVTVNQSPRYVDMDKCISCGICAAKCPATLPDEFNLNISRKKAAHIRYDQSVPLKYAIDPEACLYISRGKCRVCEKFCPTGAVNFQQAEETRELHVGAVILAPGFKPFDPSGYDFYGYPNVKDVVTSMEFERLLAVNGPNQGRLMRPSDLSEPLRIAWLQCVGSRNQNGCGNSYCSSICCMAAVKQSIASLEHTRGDRLERTVFFLDLRSHGKESEVYFERARQDGVNFVRAMPHTIEPGPDGAGVRLRYLSQDGELHNDTFDMAVLSIGFEAPEDVQLLAKKFRVQLDNHQFATSPCFEPVACNRKGVYAIGAFQSPKAISRSVVQASAAAASVATLLSEERNSLVKKHTYPDEREIKDERPLVGVFVCSCGINISGVVDVDQVVEHAKQLPGVVHAENNLFSCSADAQESIAEKIRQLGLNRVVIAACTPRTHEPLFRQTLKSAGLNGFMVEMANIRNQNSWVHHADPEGATQKAKAQVGMAVSKVMHNYPLRRERIPVVQRALVVGGGVSGMNSALALARLGIDTTLIEKSDTLGGNALKIDTSFKGEAVRPMVRELVGKVNRDRKIRVHTRTTIRSVSGSIGNFSGQFNVAGRSETIRFGAAVVATGAGEAVPSEYLYGKNPRVMTQMEFDSTLLSADMPLSKGKVYAFIQCVGSREPGRPYCSRICCVHSVRAAISIKKQDPAARIYILYRDMRTYGEWEAYYKEARELGVSFIRYEVNDKPRVTAKKGHLAIQVEDIILQRTLEIQPDFLILAAGVAAGRNQDLADLFRFTVNVDGFFNGAHPKLKPVDLSVAGLFLAGLCNYPKPLDESIEEAWAAALRVSVLLSHGRIKTEAVKSVVTEQCDGCALCIDVCPFNALSVLKTDDSGGAGKVSVMTDPGLCQGCGLCSSTCPKDGIRVHGFTRKQLVAQIRSAAGLAGRMKTDACADA